MDMYHNPVPGEREFAITGTAQALSSLGKVMQALSENTFIEGKMRPSPHFPDMLIGTKLIIDETVEFGLHLEQKARGMSITGPKAAFEHLGERLQNGFNEHSTEGTAFVCHKIEDGTFIFPRDARLLFIYWV